MKNSCIFTPITVEDLKNKPVAFWIPDYQRGYRWEEQQIRELLNDIFDFSNLCKIKGVDQCGFYCLQPIILKEVENNKFEVIDGQQRLTTLFFLLGIINNHYKDRIPEDSDSDIKFTIQYQTRNNEKSIQKLLSEVDESNIDFYYMSEAIEIIKAFLADRKGGVGRFIETLYKNVKLLWYVVDKENGYADDSVKIFQNINAGKIPLTNAELIKALLLNIENFTNNKKDEQFAWGMQWDIIERELQSDELWYFLATDEQIEKSSTHIDLIFEIIAEQEKSKDSNKDIIEKIKSNKSYESFNVIYAIWNNQNNDKGKYARNILAKMKETYQQLLEWFENITYYHHIGFLRSFNVKLSEICNATKGKKKNEVYEELKKMVVANLLEDNGKKKDGKLGKIEYIKSLTYDNPKPVRKVLLWFNILSMSEGYKFSFYQFKKKLEDGDKWDLEHIHSQDDTIKTDEREDWILLFKEACKNIDDADKKALVQEAEKIDFKNEQQYKDLEKRIIAFFGGSGGNGIDNLSLLQSGINRAYTNSVFPVKRHKIIEETQKSRFVPIATYNVFLKCYSNKNSSQMFMWTEEDRKDYLSALIKKIDEYLEGDNVDEQF